MKNNSELFDGLVFTLGVLGMVIIPLIFSSINKPKHSEEYPQTMVVAHFNEYIDSATIETATGYQYSFWGVEDYQVGDIVAVIMNDNATETIEDDKIVSVRFSGYVKGDVE